MKTSYEKTVFLNIFISQCLIWLRRAVEEVPIGVVVPPTATEAAIPHTHTERVTPVIHTPGIHIDQAPRMDLAILTARIAMGEYSVH